MKVQRVERHVINNKHPCFKSFDELCFKSKNLYNYANYIIRQEYINSKKYIKYKDLTFMLKHSEPFMNLGSNSSQHTLKMLDKSWKGFFVSLKDYTKNPKKYLGRPQLPKYKSKNGRHVCILTNWQSQIKEGYLFFAFKPLKPYNNLFKTNIKGKHMQTRIIPRGGCYILEIVYECEIKEPQLTTSKNIISLDLGLDNFITIANNIGAKSIIINGRGIKSYNKYWNKQMAKYKSLAKTCNDLDWTKKLEKIANKRNNKMEYYMHKFSKEVINYCLFLNIDTVVVGINKRWKQNSKLNKSANQTFVQIPYNNFINKLKYKCEDNGIKFIETEESYTSGTSFLDDELPIKDNYDKTRRIYRGLFKSEKGIAINADLNGAYQIMRKVFPNVKADGIVGLDLVPIMVNLN